MNLTDAEIQIFVDGFCCECPRCGADTVRRTSEHERDSSNDTISCPQCKWVLSETATWIPRTAAQTFKRKPHRSRS